MNPLAIDPTVTAPLDDVLALLSWLVTAAGVGGLLWLGASMALSVRSGQSVGDFMESFLMVMVACSLAVTAGPLVAFVL
ncbi:hypothetical protein SAMN04487983_102183 [Streptomyces sp. yr375]|uniref:hypothetical protein n=1 Tax=Streptomyces sp. yr375 TaxID=1761906 RepID=UPI0008B6E3A6|nr:hypothetical protein [Streptomyces sp. yr375]SER74752.1 hypothetical protein SAMN04487983_102183 [Streptomyces sp. yr375]